MEMDFVGAFEREYVWMVDFSRILLPHSAISGGTRDSVFSERCLFYCAKTTSLYRGHPWAGSHPRSNIHIKST